jgi:hypothetical protein
VGRLRPGKAAEDLEGPVVVAVAVEEAEEVVAVVAQVSMMPVGTPDEKRRMRRRVQSVSLLRS